MRLSLIGLEQKRRKMFSRGSDFLRNLHAAKFNKPDRVVLTPVMPVRVIMIR